jgi:phosphate starvation-inducible PhoH-like protein
VVGKIEGIAFVYFDERDVVRHKLVQAIVKAYEAYGNGEAPRARAVGAGPAPARLD